MIVLYILSGRELLGIVNFNDKVVDKEAIYSLPAVEVFDLFVVEKCIGLSCKGYPESIEFLVLGMFK